MARMANEELNNSADSDELRLDSLLFEDAVESVGGNSVQVVLPPDVSPETQALAISISTSISSSVSGSFSSLNPFRFEGGVVTKLGTTAASARIYQNTTGRDQRVRIRVIKAGAYEGDVTNGPVTSSSGTPYLRIDLSVDGYLSPEYTMEPNSELWILPTGNPQSAVIVVERAS